MGITDSNRDDSAQTSSRENTVTSVTAITAAVAETNERVEVEDNKKIVPSQNPVTIPSNVSIPPPVLPIPTPVVASKSVAELLSV